MKRMMLITTLLALVAVLDPGPAHAAVNAEVAPPGAQVAGFALPKVAGVKSQPFVFVNADPLASHNVVSDDVDSHGAPLFKTAVIASGSYGTADLSKLAVGQSYGFRCTLHPNMVGTLMVEA